MDAEDWMARPTETPHVAPPASRKPRRAVRCVDAEPAADLPRKLLRKSSAAQALDVSVRTVERLIRSGELEVVRLVRDVRVSVRSIDAFIERRAHRHGEAGESGEGAAGG